VRPQVAVPPEVSDQAAAQFLVGGPACWSQAGMCGACHRAAYAEEQAGTDHTCVRRSIQSPRGVCARVH